MVADADAGSSPPGENIPSTASPPFDSESADITLRTSDNVDFHVHRAVLAIASPVFATMLELPQPERSQSLTTSDPLARSRVIVSEDSKTLDVLLRLCYPVAKTQQRDMEGIASVLEIAMKYEMEWPISFLSKELETFAGQDPLRTWAVACRLGLDGVAHTAVASLLQPGNAAKTLDLTNLVHSEGPAVLDGASAGHYFRLRGCLRQGKVDPDISLISPPPLHPSSFASLDVSSLQFFSEIPGHDVICRSRDGVEFRAHRAILSMQSPALKRSFFGGETPTSDSTEAESLSGVDEAIPKPPTLQTIVLGLSHRALALLLNICYGELDETVTTPEPPLLAELMAVSEEYEMKQVLAVVKRLWESCARRRPLDAYFTAIRYGSPASARAAAKLTLSSRAFPEQYSPSMEHAPARSYHHLMRYHQACESAVARELKSARDSWRANPAYQRYLSPTTSQSNYTPSGKEKVHIGEQEWLVTYLQRAERRLVSSNVGRALEPVLGSVALLNEAKARRAFCPPVNDVLGQLLDIGNTLPLKLTSAINEVI
ncbi:hypothetical protein BN946_scf185008.g83 [Trametes cinnabarina]|uniref:BTB domain-containing protein n=1 Tax=Pycnoporus cinnabarinus TaxID=5643 RepID=A0A060SGN1_PYCCI|nr:hypothetical protein BN946_scf185008.g83 [Trametes cinnabarina]